MARDEQTYRIPKQNKFTVLHSISPLLQTSSHGPEHWWLLVLLPKRMKFPANIFEEEGTKKLGNGISVKAGSSADLPTRYLKARSYLRNLSRPHPDPFCRQVTPSSYIAATTLPDWEQLILKNLLNIYLKINSLGKNEKYLKFLHPHQVLFFLRPAQNLTALRSIGTW